MTHGALRTGYFGGREDRDAGQEPTDPIKGPRPGLTERKEFEYRRNGTSALFAALDVHSGEVIWEPKDRTRSTDSSPSWSTLRSGDPPEDLILHLVLDNGSPYTSKHTSEWLAHPDRKDRFQVHHIPTHASSLNQVELFFSILGRQLLRRGEFNSFDELDAKISAFITEYNRKAKPFRWTYQGKPLKQHDA